MTGTAAASYAGRELWGALIGGAFVQAEDAGTFAVMEPATGQQIARVVNGGADLVDRAVAEARRAYGPWRDTPPRERGRLLRLVAAKIRAHVDELAELEAREVGKPRRDALRFDLSYCHAGYDYYAGLADTLHGEILDQGPIEAQVIYEPYGVVAAILPSTRRSVTRCWATCRRGWTKEHAWSPGATCRTTNASRTATGSPRPCWRM
jgi:acyl-CoA reductase-like NAD-dependent aldehyde dehydrogenase